MISGLLLIMAALGYLIAAVLYTALLFKEHVRSRPAWLTMARVSGIAGLVAHTAAIGVNCATTRHTPFTTSPETLSATGWTIALAYLAVDILQWRKPPAAIGAFAYPLSFLTLFLGANLKEVAHGSPAVTSQLDTQLISLHVMAILGAYGMLTVAVCCGALYLIEHRMLKSKRIATGMFSRLPPLPTIDHLAFTLVSLAFPLLTIGLVAGFIRAVSDHAPVLELKTILAMVSWAIFGGYLALHSSKLALGVRGNYLLFAGEIVTLLTFFIPSTLHSFS